MTKRTVSATAQPTSGRRFPHLAVGLVAIFAFGMTANSAMAGPTFPLGKEGSLSISYLTQMWTQYKGYSSDVNNSETTQFFLRRNRLQFAGQYNNYLGFYVQLDAPSDGKDGTLNKNVIFRDSYLTFDTSDAVRFIFGKFKQTFTRENLEDCFGPLTLDRAETISYTPFGGTRDTGIAMWGNLDNAKFQYRIMLANGRNDASVMPKHMPRVTVRMDVSLLDPEYDYGYEGTYLGTKKVLTIGAAYDYQNDVAYANYPARKDPVDYRAWTADIFWEQPFHSGTYTFSTAYMHYDTGKAINQQPDPSLPVNSQLSGYYVKAAYMLPHPSGIGRLQFFLRHENSNYHLTSHLYDQNWNSAGINYYINGQSLKITAAYAHIDFKHESATDPALQNYSQMTLALQMIF